MTRKPTDPSPRSSRATPAKPIAVVILMWLVIVTILSIGLGTINLYTIATNMRNSGELGDVILDQKDSAHYSFNSETREACARTIVPTPEDPDNCYPSRKDFNAVTTPVTIAGFVQLLALFLSCSAMWLSFQKDKLTLAVVFSLLTFIAWVLSSLLSVALFPLFS